MMPPQKNDPSESDPLLEDGPPKNSNKIGVIGKKSDKWKNRKERLAKMKGYTKQQQDPNAKSSSPQDNFNKGQISLDFSESSGTIEDSPRPESSGKTDGAGAVWHGDWFGFGSGLVLENSGSTARDHLANERTYLAWIRTALALLGASIGLLKWDAVNDLQGYLCGILGIIVLLISSRRYHRNMRLLMGGRFEPNTVSATFVATFVAALFLVVFVLDGFSKNASSSNRLLRGR